MPLTSGTRLGEFEIVASIGAGGMGEVYRARDTRLQRDVALKILPEDLAGDADRLARFEREATTLAALNHPNIAQIYGVEDAATSASAPGLRALVMELVEGEDLAHLLARRPLARADVLRIARQIAEALAAAHQAGIVHRDLKPANIRIRPDGEVKVVDFGLAKAVAAAANHDAHDEPTITSPAFTQAGIILGTASYMAPEQATGQAVDRRADVWAFGCVVYEMLAGRRAFSGNGMPEVLAAVLTREPDWRTLPHDTPESLRRLLRRCLHKDPKQRLHDIADARLEIDEAVVTPVHVMPSRGRQRWAFGLAALLFVALSATLVRLATLGNTTSARGGTPVRAQRLTDRVGLEEMPALSPDGRSVAFTGGLNGKRQLFVRLLDGGGEPLQLTREEVDHQFPRWTPSATSIVYFSPAATGERQGTLWEIPALGGSPRRVTTSLSDGDVRPSDGRLAFFRLAQGEVELTTALLDGSGSSVVARFPSDTTTYLHPRWSPDGNWIAYQRGSTTAWDIYVVSAGGGKVRQLTNAALYVHGFAWLPDGTGLLYSTTRGESMLYLATSRLWHVSFADGATYQVTSGEASYQSPDISSDGGVVVSRLELSSDIWSFPFDGQPLVNTRTARRLTHQTGLVLTPSPSPDGREVAFLSDRTGHANLWVLTVESGALRQLTHERNPDVVVGIPTWSPTGQSIAFVSSRETTTAEGLAVWLVNPDGSNLRRLVSPGVAPMWSADGTSITYTVSNSASPDARGVYRMAEGGTPVAIRKDIANTVGAHGGTRYYAGTQLVDGLARLVIGAATPEDGQLRVLARVPATRIPHGQLFIPTLSPDGKWLAQPLTDGFTTNIFALSTAKGEWRQVTDFEGRPTFIARTVSWSSDSQSILAAVAEGEADIVRLDNLLAIGQD